MDLSPTSGSSGGSRSELVRRQWARYYLENAPSLTWLIFANVAAIFVGVHFYLPTLPDVDTFLWPLYMDSPVAVLLMALSLATLLPNLGRRLDSVPTNRVLAYLHTITFVWLVETGLWTALALNLDVGAYFPDAWNYFGVLSTHLLFIPEAYLIPHYGKTTRGALATALVLVLANDIVDYGFGYHPPLRYELEETVGIVLVAGSVLTSLAAVALAARGFDRL
jgi:uncharacterized membrane protein YpjA